MLRLFDFLRSRDLPRMARPNFARERMNYLIWSLLVGTIEGNIAGIVAKKTFGASNTLATIVWAAPIFMMVLNLFWGVVIRGRRRLRVMVVLSAAVAALTLSIAFTSPNWRPWGGWVFAFQIAATHFFVTGLVTLRSSMWKVNYPQARRAQIIGRLQQIRFLFVPLAGALAARIFDIDPDYYRYVYPAAALLGLLSLVPLRRFRVRGEKLEQRLLAQRIADRAGNRRGLLAGLREAAGILVNDRAFRWYMTAQFLLGSANFFTDPVLLTIIAGQLGFDYLPSSLLMVIIPSLCSWVAIRFWAPYFDRVGVLRFRVVNCIVWLGAYSCVTAAMVLIGYGWRTHLWLPVSILVIGRALKGIGHGGGGIAWTIGHLHFAKPHQIDLYMSIHVALTGLRALLMPMLGLVANAYLGNGSFGIAIALSVASLLLFRKLARDEARRARATAEPSAEEIGPPVVGPNVS